MTVETSVRKAGPYEGNGATIEFPFSFKVFSRDDVRVTFADEGGIESTLELDVDYAVQLNEDQEHEPGGVVTYPVSGPPLAAGERITLSGRLGYVQPTSITNQGGFYPRVIEDALDRATIQIQQLAEQVSRAILAPISGGVSGEELTQQLAEQLPYVVVLHQYIDQIIGVYSNLDEINTVDSLQGEIHALAQIRSAIETLASIESELQALVPALPMLENDIAPHVQDIHIVADDLNASWQSGVQYDFGLIIDEPSGPGAPPEGYIATVANNIDHIIAVEGDIGYVKNVSDNMPQVLDVSTNITSVVSVAGNLQKIQDILDIEGKIDSVIANETNITAVADNETNINAAVANEVNINAVVTNQPTIDAVAGNEANINAAVANEGNINAAVANKNNINSVVSNEANINTVATNIVDVNSVGMNISDVNTAAQNISGINTVANIATDVSTVADNEIKISAIGRDLTGQPIVIDYGDLGPVDNPASPAGVLGDIWSARSDIHDVSNDIDNIVYVAQNLAAILSALSGALVPANNLSELTDPAQARANLGLADLGGLN